MKNLLYSLVLLLFFVSCADDKPASDNANMATTTTDSAIPKLLDRQSDLQQGKEWDQVQSLYGQTTAKLRENPHDDQSYLLLAQLFVNEARITGEHGHYYPGALKVINMAMQDDVVDKDLRFRLLTTRATVELAQHEFQTGLATAQEAVKLNPYNAQIYGALVDAYVELGQYDKAVEMADKMVSIKPDLRSYSRVSYLREIHGDVKGSIEAMNLAVDAGYPGYESSAWARLTLGGLHERYGKKEDARIQYQLALMDRPDYPFAIAELAKIDLEDQKYESAESQLRTAMKIAPEISFYETMAKLYKEQGRTEELLQIEKEMMVMLQDDVDSGHQMDLEYAKLYMTLYDDPAKALPYALTEYAKRPDNIDVNRELAMIYVKLNQLDKAQEHYIKASRTNSKHPELAPLQTALAMK